MREYLLLSWHPRTPQEPEVYTPSDLERVVLGFGRRATCGPHAIRRHHDKRARNDCGQRYYLADCFESTAITPLRTLG
jgi:hypothetical protein